MLAKILLMYYPSWSEDEINSDLKEKVNILQWMLTNNIEDVNHIGMIMSKYYIGNLVLD